MNIDPNLPPMDNDITNCINQLAERAIELGEKHTACVLYSLAAHRIVNADTVMAITAGAHSLALKEILEKKIEEFGETEDKA